MNINAIKKSLYREADNGASGGAGASAGESVGAGGSVGTGSEGASTSVFEDAPAGTEGGEGTQEKTPPQENQSGQQSQEGAGKAAPAGDQAWTPEKVQELIKTAAAAGATANQPQGQPQSTAPEMTQEQLDKMLNVYRPSAEEVNALLEGGDGAVSAMQKIIEGAVKQATTTAWLQAQYVQQQMSQQINPLLTAHQEQQMTKLREEFFTTHPDLKGREKLLGAVKAALDQQQALNGLDKKAAFTLIAEKAKEVLAAGGQGEAGGNGGGSPPPKQPPTLSRGSQHGSAPAGAGGGAAPGDAERIFG
jgi:hypothetical protein